MRACVDQYDQTADPQCPVCELSYDGRIKARGLLTRDINYFNNKYITGALSPEGIISGTCYRVDDHTRPMNGGGFVF